MNTYGVNIDDYYENSLEASGAKELADYLSDETEDYLDRLGCGDMDFEKERNVTKEDMSTLASLGVEKAFRQFKEENDTDTHFYCVGHSVIKYYWGRDWLPHLLASNSVSIR